MAKQDRADTESTKSNGPLAVYHKLEGTKKFWCLLDLRRRPSKTAVSDCLSL